MITGQYKYSVDNNIEVKDVKVVLRPVLLLLKLVEHVTDRNVKQKCVRLSLPLAYLDSCQVMLINDRHACKTSDFSFKPGKETKTPNCRQQPYLKPKCGTSF